MPTDAGRKELCKCPECGGQAIRRYMSSHPFGAGTGYYEYKASSCPICGGEKPLAAGWTLPAAVANYNDGKAGGVTVFSEKASSGEMPVLILPAEEGREEEA